ncbi:hypothetical protein [Thalassobius sp. Cn5-15]|jgi:hypothetical protein|uniref:hypothetical protein n=1 Tax=Thalassobius sp. Cn5-15 TaxID=2917763 RepID=UPI001EF270A5|nr:hypothetical protein [Thalassobius sp. Cn5-15]MCG7492796.1 hypothetical protein [Thalassobius sp. Cn5-15]
MSSRKVRTLTRNLGRYRTVNEGAEDTHQDFQLVRQETHLSNVSQVERFLPDILGRALARCWIDKGFRQEFYLAPKDTLSDYHVHLPEDILVSVETDPGERSKVVVYEQVRGALPKRLMYLQLVMMAGR